MGLTAFDPKSLRWLVLCLVAFAFCWSDAEAYPTTGGSGESAVSVDRDQLLAKRRKKKRRRRRGRRSRRRKRAKRVRATPVPKRAAAQPAPRPARAAPSAANPTPPRPEAGLQRGARVEFDGRLVQGQTAKSGAIYLFARKRSELRSMVEERASYKKEIVRTVYPSYGEKQ